MTHKKYNEETDLVHLGRDPDAFHGMVNPVIARSSTILYPSLAAYDDPNHKYRYGRVGNPVSDNFEQAMAKLENGYGAISTPSGLSAITTALQTFLKSGDHLLMCDSIYPPTRFFCNHILKKYGVEVEYYDPKIGADIQTLSKPNTVVIYLESPGSATFDIQDMPAIVKVAQDKNIITIADNTWSGGILFKPLDHGVDIALQSATKYISGHSDVNLGFVVAKTENHTKMLRKTMIDLGVCAAPEDIYLALRGLRTMKIRMQRAAQSALQIADWLAHQKEVQRVYHPALPSDQNHDLWKRDFNGSNGLLSILLQPADKKAVTACVDSLKLFPIGSSWGGYESLLQPQDSYIKKIRTAVPWNEKGALLRFQIGLEDPKDLIEDLEQSLDKFRKEKG